jgi:RNA polymerase primary sigma factor
MATSRPCGAWSRRTCGSSSATRHYRRLGVPFLDLIHEGNLGLIEAAARVRSLRNVKFITYAVWWIRQAIAHALSDQTRAFSMPAKVWRSRRASPAARRSDGNAGHYLERRRDCRRHGDLDREADAVPSPGRGPVAQRSCRDRAGRRRAELADLIPQRSVPPVEEELVRRAFADQVCSALSDLDPKERQVMAARYGCPTATLTLQQIGDRSAPLA